MRTFFYPESVAVFGVSESPSNLARIIVENLERFNYGGQVYAVGPRKGTVAGREIATDLSGVDAIPGLAVLLIPAERVPGTLEECGRKGIRYAIVESGGFSELSADMRRLEDQIRAVRDRWGMKIIGPNCFGAINLETGLTLPFFILDPRYMKAGPVSLISQSGGILYDTCMLASSENVGLNKLVSIGNKLLLNENECLEYLVSDPGTGVIGLYLEDFCDGRRLVEIACTTEKPIVLLKANRSPAGREIARFHTAALAGDDLVAQAALKEAGIHQVETLAEMMDAFKIFSLPAIKGRRLALITRSGGHGVLAADGASRYGFELARLTDGFFAAVKEQKINVIRTTNPVDVGDVYDIDAYAGILERAFQEEGVDGVVFVVTFSSEMDALRVERFIAAAREQCGRYGKPVALCLVSNREQWARIRETADFPLFSDVALALKALALSADHLSFGPKRAAARARLTGVRRASPPDGVQPDVRGVQPQAGQGRIMGSKEAFSLLETAGLNVAPYGIATDLESARILAGAIGYPVAVKIESPRLLHKTEKAGVVLDIADDEALREALSWMDGEVYLIQKMAHTGHEVIIGGKRDPEFGHVLLFGLGGLYVEVFGDAAIRLAPVDEKTAAEMVGESRGAAILRGVRGRPAADVAAIAKALVKASKLLTEHPEIKNLDINPLIAYDDGQGAIIVDAKIEVD